MDQLDGPAAKKAEVDGEASVTDQVRRGVLGVVVFAAQDMARGCAWRPSRTLAWRQAV